MSDEITGYDDQIEYGRPWGPSERPVATETTTSGGDNKKEMINMINNGIDLMHVVEQAQSPLAETIHKGTMYDYGRLPGAEQFPNFMTLIAQSKRADAVYNYRSAAITRRLGYFLGDSSMIAEASKQQELGDKDYLQTLKANRSQYVLTNQDQFNENEIAEARITQKGFYHDLYKQDTLGKNVGAKNYDYTAEANRYLGWQYMFPTLMQLSGMASGGGGGRIQITDDDRMVMDKIDSMANKGELTFDRYREISRNYQDNPVIKNYLLNKTNTNISDTEYAALYLKAQNGDLDEEQQKTFAKLLGSRPDTYTYK